MSTFIEDLSEKTTLTDNDLGIIADSQASNQNKRFKFSSLWTYIKSKCTGHNSSVDADMVDGLHASDIIGCLRLTSQKYIQIGDTYGFFSVGRGCQGHSANYLITIGTLHSSSVNNVSFFVTSGWDSINVTQLASSCTSPDLFELVIDWTQYGRDYIFVKNKYTDAQILTVVTIDYYGTSAELYNEVENTVHIGNTYTWTRKTYQRFYEIQQ